jgi:hypothetical protein
MRRICDTINSGVTIRALLVVVLSILVSQPCFSECEFGWKPTVGLNDSVSAFTVYKGDLIAGGRFTTAGVVDANNIASWDGGNWQPLGGGVNSSVYALAVYDGNLIAGGWFTTAEGISTNRIAQWDGNSWQSLGGVEGGSYEYVSALTVYEGELIAGGYFTTTGGVSANFIARWNGSTWQPLGSGMNGAVSTLSVYNGELIAGGWFTTAGGVEAKYIARWDGSSWHAFGSNPVPDEYHFLSTLAVYNGELIAGIETSTALSGYEKNNGLNYITRWDGSTWQPLGTGVNGDTNALTVYDGELIAGGGFSMAGGIPVNDIARWNGSIWRPLGSGVEGSGYAYVLGLSVYKGELIVGGDFTTAGGESSAYIARWGVPEVYKGDLNHNCRVSYADLEWFAERWLNDDCVHTGWCYEADLNYDGVVDLLDYAELAASWRYGGIPGDIDNDWEVNFADYALFANYWQGEDCNEPGWCGGADLNKTGQVNILDLSILIKYWLEKD